MADDDDDFNLEAISRELEETRTYLQDHAEVFRRSTTSLRGSADFASTARDKPAPTTTTTIAATVSSSSSLSPSAPSSANSREDLIQKLLWEYNERKAKSSSSRSYWDETDDPLADHWQMLQGEAEQQQQQQQQQQQEEEQQEEQEGVEENYIFFAGREEEEEDLAETVRFVSEEKATHWPEAVFLPPRGNETRSVDGDSLDFPPPPAAPAPPPPAPPAPAAPARTTPSSSSSSSAAAAAVPHRHRYEESPEPRHRPPLPPSSAMTTTNKRTGRPLDRRQRDDPEERYSMLSKDLARRKSRSKERLVKEAKQRFTEAHPFKPTLYTSSQSPERGGGAGGGGGGGGGGKVRVEQLHAEHAERLRRREVVRQELEEVERLQCSFRPQLAPASEKIARARSVREQEEEEEAQVTEDVSSRLHHYAAKQARYQHELSQFLLQQSLSECSFQPQLIPSHRYNSNGSGSGSVSGGSAGGRKKPQLPLHERLADIQRQRQRSMAILREVMEKEEQERMTFRPQIDEKSRRLVQRRRATGGGGGSGSSSPSPDNNRSGVSDAISILAQQQEEEEDVGNRLLREGQRIARRRQELQWQQEEEMANLISEHPKMSRGSQRLTKQKEYLQEDFMTRQQRYRERWQAHDVELRTEIDKEQSQWFQPPPPATRSLQILRQHRPHLLEETESERYDRLAHGDAEAKANHRRALEQEIYSQLRFQPTLIAKSSQQSMTNSFTPSIEELYQDNRGKLARERIKHRVEEEESSKCTFRPEINSRSRQLIAQVEEEEQAGGGGGGDSYDILYRMYHATDTTATTAASTAATSNRPRRQRVSWDEPERMAQMLRLQALRKEEQRREELIARELQELQACTFQPNLSTQSYFHKKQHHDEDDEPLVVVPGLGRHLELRALARRQREEAAEREKEVFSVPKVDRYRRAEDGSTIVQGFTFRTEARGRRKEEPE